MKPVDHYKQLKCQGSNQLTDDPSIGHAMPPVLPMSALPGAARHASVEALDPGSTAGP